MTFDELMASTSSQPPSASAAAAAAASTSQTTSSSTVSYITPPSSSETPSSSAPPPLPWDVFLSFRGEDTRNNFTSHLYKRLVDHGIRTFRDVPALRPGDVISESLIQGIKDSKTYIVIFSENYATSGWCLNELLEIYNCYQTMNRLIIAVYHNIEPSVVRYQTKSFKKAFKKHKSRAEMRILKMTSAKEKCRSKAAFAKLKTWKETLADVAGLSGQTVAAHK